MKFFTLLSTGVLLLSFSNINAQCDLSLLADSAQFVLDGQVVASTQTGHTLFIGGSFTRIGKVTGSSAGIDTGSGAILARSSWPRINGTIEKIISDGAGGFIIGGTFSSVGSAARTNLAWIDAGGNLTAWSPNPDGKVSDIAISGGTLYVVGTFTNISSTGRGRGAAYDMSSGTLQAWNPAADGAINAIALSGSTAYLGGAFSILGAASRHALGATDISTSAATAWNPDAGSGTIMALAIADTTIYAGGAFSGIGTQSRSNIARIGMAGGMSTSWNPAVNGIVYAILPTATGVYAGGAFTQAGVSARAGFAEIDGTGATAAANLSFASGATVRAMSICNGALYVAGAFSSGNSTTGVRSNLVRYDLGSMTRSSWDAAPDGQVNSLVMSGIGVYAGGAFNVVAAHRANMAGIDMDGDVLTAFNTGNIPASVPAVTAITAGGGYVFTGGGASLKAWDTLTGQAATGFSPAIAFTAGPASINDLKYYNGTLYVAGQFNQVNASSRYNVAALNAGNGTLQSWNPAGTSAPATTTVVRRLDIYNDTAYLLGNFTSMGGASRSYIAAVNLADGAANGLNLSPNAQVNAIAFIGDKLYLGGAFSYVGAALRPYLARVNLSNYAVESYNPAINGDVTSLATRGSQVYVSGTFTTVYGAVRARMALVDTSMITANAWNPAPSATIRDFARYGGKVYTYGTYASINGGSQYAYFTAFNNPALSGYVSVAGSSVMCSGTAATYTATASSGATAYQWKVNGVNAGTSTTAYSYTPSNGDVVTCSISLPSGQCYTANPVSSTAIALTVNSSLTPAVSIAGNSAMCGSAATTYTATSNIGTAAYQWQVNGLPVTGATAAAYSYTPANNDAVSCSISTSGGGCYTATGASSNTVSVSVATPVIPAATVTSSATTLCNGSAVSFTASSNVSGGTYQWVVNGAGSSAGSAFSYTPVNNDAVTCIVTVPAAGCWASATDTSNVVLMTVNPIQQTGISIQSPATNVAAGSSITLTAAVSNAGAGYSIVWKNHGATIATTGVPTLTTTKGTGIDSFTAELSNTSGCYIASASNALMITEITATTAVHGIGGSAIAAYPNPFTNSLRLTGMQPGNVVQLYDISGRMLYSQVISDGRPEQQIALPDMPAGMYRLRVQDASGALRMTALMQRQ